MTKKNDNFCCDSKEIKKSNGRPTYSPPAFKYPNSSKEANQNEELTHKNIVENKIEFNCLTISNAESFRGKVLEYISEITNSIECTEKQKKTILLKSEEILNAHFLRAERNEITIPKNANLKKIAATIIWTAALSNENMPKITRRNIVKLANIDAKSNSDISSYYKKYFAHLYPRVELRFSSYPGFKNIRNIISLYILELMEQDNKISEFAEHVMQNVLTGHFPKQLTKEDNSIFFEMVTKYEDSFIDYFSDLAEVVKQLVISSETHKKIGAHIVIKYIAKFLAEKDINLFHKNFDSFYESVREIFNFLKVQSPLLLSVHSTSQEREVEQKDYEIIVGNKLKFYIMKEIYNGKYFDDGFIKCPKCVKEGLIINTKVSRIISFEFHHSTSKKENKFTTKALYDLFVRNQDNPNVLEFIIKLMEREKVEILCRNHHNMLNAKYFTYFKHIINWEDIPEKYPQDIYSLSAELIYILIRVSINNHPITKHKSINEKKEIKRYLINYIKKRCIIKPNGLLCPTCREFDINEHLPVFHFMHFSKVNKTVNASDLYSLNSTSEIAKTLEQEIGMHTCSNCHSIFDFKRFHLLDKIYEEDIIKKIFNDHKNISQNLKPFQYTKSIKDFLKKSNPIKDNIEQYLNAIYDISKSGIDVTYYTLADYLGIDSRSAFNFFNRNDIITQYVNIETRKGNNPSKLTLNKEGRDAFSLISYIKDYYRRLL